MDHQREGADHGEDVLGDGFVHADQADRVAALPHGVADTYDYGYGLARDRGGAFVYTFAPYANTNLPGSGSALRLVPGKKPQEVSFGFRLGFLFSFLFNFNSFLLNFVN